MVEQANTASSIDFNQFRCTLCKKYLSVGPIYIFTDKPREGENICGRCQIPQGNNVSRNFAFEAMAQYLKFPCIHSNTCSRKLPWGEVEKHEVECKINCVICWKSLPVTEIVTHFELMHRKNLFYCVLSTNVEEIRNSNSANLIVISNEPYLITTHFSFNIEILSVKVVPLLESYKHKTFTITFKNENRAFGFKGKHIKRQDNEGDWVKYDFNSATWNEINLSNKSVKIELEIDQVAKKTNAKRQITILPDNAFGRFAQILKCPVCTEFMDKNIVVCTCGHSICEMCKNRCSTDVCPICKSPFGADRNFALEDVYKILKDFALQ